MPTETPETNADSKAPPTVEFLTARIKELMAEHVVMYLAMRIADAHFQVHGNAPGAYLETRAKISSRAHVGELMAKLAVVAEGVRASEAAFGAGASLRAATIDMPTFRVSMSYAREATGAAVLALGELGL